MKTAAEEANGKDCLIISNGSHEIPESFAYLTILPGMCLSIPLVAQSLPRMPRLLLRKRPARPSQHWQTLPKSERCHLPIERNQDQVMHLLLVAQGLSILTRKNSVRSLQSELRRVPNRIRDYTSDAVMWSCIVTFTTRTCEEAFAK